MNVPIVPLEDRRTLFLMAYSSRTFEHVAALSDFILTHQEYCNHPISHSLATALVVQYAKPFGRWQTRKGTPRITLPPDIVPEEHQALHLKTLDLRDRLFAHMDLDCREIVKGTGSAVGLKSENGRVQFFLREIDLTAIPVRGLRTLAGKLQAETDRRTVQVLTKHNITRIDIPKGVVRYINLCLDHDSDDLFITGGSQPASPHVLPTTGKAYREP